MSGGYELWIGMLSDSTISKLEDITSLARPHDTKAVYSAFTNLSRLLRIACADMFTERQRLTQAFLAEERW